MHKHFVQFITRTILEFESHIIFYSTSKSVAESYHIRMLFCLISSVGLVSSTNSK